MEEYKGLLQKTKKKKKEIKQQALQQQKEKRGIGIDYVFWMSYQKKEGR